MKEVIFMEMEQFLQMFTKGKYKLRVIFIDGEAWYVARDVATCLEYADPKSAVRKNVESEDKMVLSQKQIEQMASESKVAFFSELEIESPRGLKLVNESGLWSLVLRSHLPEAKKLKRWLTAEVFYGAPEGGEMDEVAEFLAKLPPESVNEFITKILKQTQDEIDNFTKAEPLYRLLEYCGGNVKLREKLIILIAEFLTGKTL